MNPCPFIRLTISNLALKTNSPSTTTTTKPPRNLIHPTTATSAFCKIKLKGFRFPPQTAVIPYSTTLTKPPPECSTVSALFHISKDQLDQIARSKGRVVFRGKCRRPCLVIRVYAGLGGMTCGAGSGRMVGKVCVGLDGVEAVEGRGKVFLSGWSRVGKKGGGGGGESELRVCVRADPDPRFVFRFDGDPECSPQVCQIGGGSLSQPVFSCSFSFRSTGVGDRHQRTRSLQSEPGSGKGWLSSFGSERERQGKERKGWSITVHDLSGSPVAVASMVTPFVASPGSDRVSRSNPGSWLILRPGEGTWKPWGRLEAWRERGNTDSIGYKFELIPDGNSSSGVVLAESTLSTTKGGKFTIDLASPNNNTNIGNNNGWSRFGQRSSSSSPRCSPRVRGGSGDFGSWLWPYSAYRGFVMSASVEGEGKCSKPTIEVSVQHVSCTEDAAVFVALGAAIDLSIDACRLFSQKLRKELCQNNELG